MPFLSLSMQLKKSVVAFSILSASTTALAFVITSHVSDLRSLGPWSWIPLTVIFVMMIVASVYGLKRVLRPIDSWFVHVDELKKQIAEKTASLREQLQVRLLAEERLRTSESRTKAILNAALDCVILIDAQNNILEFNPSAERTFILHREDVLGKSIHECIFPPLGKNDEQQNAKQFWEARDTEVVGKRVQMIAMRSNGEEFPIEISIARVPVDGPPIYTAVLRDITEQKEAERERNQLLEELQASQARFEAVVNQMPAGLLVASAPSGNIVLSNRQADEIVGELGAESEEVWSVRGRFQLHRMDGSVLQSNEHPLARSITRGEVVTHEEAVVIHPDGKRIVIDISSAPIFNRGGKVVAGVATFFDITDRKRAERQARIHTEALERANQDLKQFAYVASHDLQEPLRMVASFTQLLSRRYHDKLDEEADKFIDYAVQGAKQMQELIRSLLDYSRSGRDDIPLQSIDSNESLEAAIRNLNSVIAETGARIKMEPMPTVMSDGVQLRQLFQNLIGNALKFTDPGVTPQIEIGAELTSEGYVFHVRDNGIGIEEEDKDRIFVIFKRLHDRTTYSGSGVGLSICKKIVHRHGGRIWVESSPGKGSTFYFLLPEVSTLRFKDNEATI